MEDKIDLLVTTNQSPHCYKIKRASEKKLRYYFFIKDFFLNYERHKKEIKDTEGEKILWVKITGTHDHNNQEQV